MQKITKNILKDIVKECLVEILAEGIFPDREMRTSDKTYALKEGIKGANRSESPRKRRTAVTQLEKPRQERERKPPVNNKMLETAQSLTNDPILNEVLADTAQTTLPGQMRADAKSPSVLSSVAGMPGADQAARVVENNDPSDIFGEETASKWAQLAFNG